MAACCQKFSDELVLMNGCSCRTVCSFTGKGGVIDSSLILASSPLLSNFQAALTGHVSMLQAVPERMQRQGAKALLQGDYAPLHMAHTKKEVL